MTTRPHLITTLLGHRGVINGKAGKSLTQIFRYVNPITTRGDRITSTTYAFPHLKKILWLRPCDTTDFIVILTWRWCIPQVHTYISFVIRWAVITIWKSWVLFPAVQKSLLTSGDKNEEASVASPVIQTKKGSEKDSIYVCKSENLQEFAQIKAIYRVSHIEVCESKWLCGVS